MINAVTLLGGISGDLSLEKELSKKTSSFFSCFSRPKVCIDGTIFLTMENNEDFIIAAKGNQNEGLDIACLISGLKAANYQLSGKKGEGDRPSWGPVPPGIRRRSTFDVRDVEGLMKKQ